MIIRNTLFIVAVVTSWWLLPATSVAQAPPASPVVQAQPVAPLTPVQAPAPLTPAQPQLPVAQAPVAPTPVAPVPQAPMAQFAPGAPIYQTQETQTVIASIEVLQSFTAFRAQAISQSMLNEAQAVAIIPNVVKGGFVLAGRFGRGVLLVRNPDGNWSAPTFITFSGGSVGWQVGLQSSDVVLVFKNRKGVEKMLTGSSFTLGADASVAAGPVGRQASAGTDIKLNAEVYSYSRARGLFVGASLDGSVVKIDNRAVAAFYNNGTVMPDTATQLVSILARDSAGPTVPPAASPGPMPVPGAAVVPSASIAASPEQLRQEMVAASRSLEPLLDATWRGYLALPPEMLAGPQPPPRAEVVTVLERYDRVQADPTYKLLADRVEFHTVHNLLKRYLAITDTEAAPANGLGNLPPPPSAAATQPSVKTR